MSDIPTHVASWTSPVRDLEANDRSRFRGDTPPGTTVETDLGNGMTQTTYVDCAAAPVRPSA